MPPVGFEPTISADERPHTYALDRAANGTGNYNNLNNRNLLLAVHTHARTRAHTHTHQLILIGKVPVFKSDRVTRNPNDFIAIYGVTVTTPSLIRRHIPSGTHTDSMGIVPVIRDKLSLLII